MSARDDEAGTADATLTGWVAGANALAMLAAAQESGVLDALAAPRAPSEVAATLGLEERAVAVLCQALEAHGVVRRDTDGCYQATAGFVELAAATRPTTLSERVAFMRALGTGIANAFSPRKGNATLAPDEALVLARSVWGRATSPQALASWAEVDSQLPEIKAVWEKGARHAELGCGAGRDLVRVAAMYPNVEAVGYELIPEVAAECRRLAAEVGVAERVTVHVMDATTLEIDSAYATVMWSQMFFGPATRGAAIAAIRRALKPGGFLIMPLMADLPAPDGPPPTTHERFLLLASLAYRRWDLRWESSTRVREELEAEGFDFVRTVPHPRTPFMVMKRH